jgi:exo-beta-1,3-glucanase (GH17 family)
MSTLRQLFALGLFATAAAEIPPSVAYVRAQGATAEQCLATNGLAYGPFRDGQGPEGERPVYPRVEQIDEDLRFLSRLTKRIRTYSTTSTQAEIPRIAKKYGVAVAQGIYIGPDDRENDRQVAAALDLARAGLVDSLIVGNEVLTAANGSKEAKSRLVKYLRRVRKEAPSKLPITTAETWNQWNSNPDMVKDVDFVMAHFYPFWEGRSIVGANDDLWRNYETLQQTLAPANPPAKPRIVIGETGWPSAGGAREAADPGGGNARRFIEEFLASACRRGVPFYFFSAFDEEWKWQEGNSATSRTQSLPRDRTFTGAYVGSSWGLYNSNGRLKSALTGLLSQPDPGSRREREIYGEQLAAFYGMGVDTSHKRRDWLTTGEELEMAYPAKQDWGAVFITVGEPTNPPRPWRDFSGFDAITFELRGARGKEKVEVGIKDFADPSNGQEKKLIVRDVGTQYRTYTFRLADFASRQLQMPNGLRKLNVVVEFVFTGSDAITVYARNIRYTSTR